MGDLASGELNHPPLALEGELELVQVREQGDRRRGTVLVTEVPREAPPVLGREVVGSDLCYSGVVD